MTNNLEKSLGGSEEKRVCFVIPTKNEAASIRKVIEEIREISTTLSLETVVIVVDDSTDDTRHIAVHAGAIVVRGDGDGLGSAMFKGLKECLEFDPDIILSIDGDGQNAVEEIPDFLAPILADEADMVLGTRFLAPDLIKYRYKLINRFGVMILSNILRRQTGLTITDSHGGLRAMKPEVARSLFMLGTHTYVQETIIDAAEKGFRIIEIPSVWKKRDHGKSRVVGSIPTYVFYTLPVLFLRSGQHIRLMVTVGLLFILTAFAIFGMIIAQEGFTLALGHRTPAFVLITLFVISGSQLFLFGLVLQLLKQIKRRVDESGTESRE